MEILESWSFKWWICMINYYINSNNGDYITEDTDKEVYIIHLIARCDEAGKYISGKMEILTKSQFLSIKGFVPIKKKKLFSQDRHHKSYLLAREPRTEIPSIQDIRDTRLDKILKK